MTMCGAPLFNAERTPSLSKTGRGHRSMECFKRVHLKVRGSLIHYLLYRWKIGSARKSGDLPRDGQR